MKNVVKRIAFLVATLVMLISFGCSSAFAATCLFGHKAVATSAVEATCTANGSYGGTHCSKCGTVIEAPTVVPAKGHTRSEVPTIVPATVEADGAYVYSCVNCNMAMDSVAISKIDLVKLSTTKCTYNGKVRKPTVTVKDTDGKTLVNGKDYDVIYPSGMKLPGKYDVTISFKGEYSGEKKVSFTIAPKATTGVKAKNATASSLVLSWSKTTGATGYRVYQYSSSKGKYVLKNSVEGTSCTVTGLKGNTTYKFKIRPYTKAEDGTVILGDYSSVLSAKTTYGVSFTDSSATIYVGETKQIKATTAPSGQKLTWKSSNTSVAKVSSSGKVTTVKNGTATITASFKYKDKTYKSTYTIIVKKPSVTLSETTATITEGKTSILTATTNPADLKVTWKSNDTSVATVSSAGKVTAIESGVATITASITYKGITYKTTCKVTVKSAAENITTLIEYIKKNGTTNVPGRTFIRLSDYEPEYDEFTSFLITYDEENDNIEFSITDYKGSGLLTTIFADLDRSGTYVDFTTFILNSYYSVKMVGSIKASEYTSEYDAYDYWDGNTFPSNMKSQLNSTLYKYTDKAMKGWDYFVYKVVGLRLDDLGFTNYH